MLRSDLCDYRDPYIVVKRTLDLLAAAANKNYEAKKNVAFKKCCSISIMYFKN